MKRLLLIFSMLLFSFGFSQSNENYVKTIKYNNTLESSDLELVLNESVSNKDFSAIRSIILKPGFRATGSVALKILSEDVIPNQERVIYYDGLGKVKQQVDIGQSPERYDIVQPFEYDEYGREAKGYLAYEDRTGTLGEFRSGALLNVREYYKRNYPDDFQGILVDNINPYIHKEFEASPTSRVLRESNPGELFKMGSGHELKYDYDVNKVDEVRKFVIDSNERLTGFSSFYNKGVLKKTVVKGKNWKVSDGKNYTSEHFKDKLGRLILKRNYNNNQPYDTYYVYDDYDNLRYVLPPKIIELEPSNTTYSNYSQSWDVNDFLEGTPVSGVLELDILDNVLSIKGSFTNTDFSTKKLKPLTVKTIAVSSGLQDVYLGDVMSLLPAKKTGELRIENGKLIVERTSEVDFFSVSFNVSVPLLTTETISKYALDNLAYQYKYDGFNRLIEKKIPGKPWEYIVYDDNDRPILTQDGVLKNNNQWVFSKYDTFGRIIYTGLYSNDKSRVDLQEEVLSYIRMSNKNNSEDRTQETNTIGQVSINYENKAFPTQNIVEVNGVNYYDNYAFEDADKPSLPTSVLGQNVTDRTNGLLTSTWVKTLGKNTWTKDYIFYNRRGQILKSHTKNHLGGYSISSNVIKFSGAMTKSVTLHKKTISDSEIKITDEFEYDHAFRLKTHTQQINDQSKVVISNNTYDGLGMLVQKKVGGIASSPLQTIDYKYNVNGDVISVNDVDSNLLNSSENDLFAFKLNYEHQIEGSIIAPRLYNGNVTQTVWKDKLVNKKQSYTYTYDHLSQLKSAKYSAGSNLNADLGKFDVTNLDYDKEGNITSLIRKGNGVQVDNLSYKYEKSNDVETHKLINVNDNSNNEVGYKDITTSNDCYTYDNNGRLISDRNKGVTNISYNYLDLPTEITFSNGNKLQITYDATGKKLEKMYVTSNNTTKTLYIDGFQYENNQLQFFANAEGYTYKDGVNYKNAYVYLDHLGNNRLSYTDSNEDGTISDNEILSKTDYYPFGLIHNGEFVSSTGSKFNYKFQGKELTAENGINQYDFGSRMYDGSVGRWFVVDPQADSFYGMSPYMAMGNNPIIIVDPDGEFWHIVIGAVVGGIVNVIGNLDNISSFGEGLAYFGVGAASGAVGALAGPLGFAGAMFGSGAISGFGNGIIQGKSGYDLFSSTVMGGTTSLVGGSLAKGISPYISKLGVDKLTNGITNEYLKNALKYGITSSLTGGITGGTISSLTGGSFGDGFKDGAISGGISGVSYGLYQGKLNIEKNRETKLKSQADQEFLKESPKKKVIEVDNKEIEGRGKLRATQFSSEWKNSSLKQAIKKFAPGSKGIGVLTKKGKIIFKNYETGIQIVYDKSGNYFRIENTSLSGRRTYLDLSGNVPNNKVVSGKVMGRSQAEYNQVTHFNNTDK